MRPSGIGKGATLRRKAFVTIDYSQRAPLTAPLTALQSIVVYMLAHEQNYAMIGEFLQFSPLTAKFHAERAAMKMPGTLPAQMRCVCWYRGASVAVLEGHLLEQKHIGAQYPWPERDHTPEGL